MKKILITGATGFVGKHLIKELLSHQESEIIGTYRSDTSESIDGVTLEKIDLLNEEAVDRLIAHYQPNEIYHLAGLSSAAVSFKSPAESITNNIIAELSIFEALRKHELIDTKVLVVSTAEVYGSIDPADIPIDEETKLRPVNPYAVSKIAQDYLGLQYFLSYNLHIVRARPFNHIGPGQKETFVIASFAKQIADIEKKKSEPVIFVGNLEAKRDFTDVRDMVKAYRFAIAVGAPGEVYNIGSGISRKVEDMLKMLLANSKESIEIKTDPARMRPIDVPEIVCDYTKFHELTNWKPEIPIENTLQDILDYWRGIV